eukprot:gene11699-biopygen9375
MSWPEMRIMKKGLDPKVLKQYKMQLSEKKIDLKDCDRKILDSMAEEADDDALDQEMEDVSDYREKITQAIKAIIAVDEILEGLKSSDLLNLSKPSRSSFQENLSLFEEPAKGVIKGIPITEANYELAVTLLKKRYAKPSIIRRGHINQMINIQPVFSERNVTKLRLPYDKVETHFRGLEAQEVDQASYSGIVVPVILDKIPENVRYNKIRLSSSDHLEWNMKEMLTALERELVIRESHTSPSRAARESEVSRREDGYGLSENKDLKLKPKPISAPAIGEESETPLNPAANAWVGCTGSGLGERVALQTTLASRVRVLFDSGREKVV